MSKYAQRLTLHRMTLAENRYRRGKIADVGSVSCVPSTAFRTAI
jgi:hypothetical protein